MKMKAVPSRHPLALALSAILAASLVQPVYAQDDVDEDENTEETGSTEEAKEMEEVVVTGSLIQRLGFDSISPVQVITSDVSATTGQLDTTTILQSTNVASGSTQISNQFSGFVVEGGNGVQTLSLRGLGAQRTLVLLDNRRPGPAGTRGQVGAFDLNVIPSVILQRVEILKDGAASTYGSDAVAGVVNLITRKSVDSPELIVDANVPLEDGGMQYSASGATGWNFETGSVVAAFQYYKQDNLTFGDRDFFRCQDDLVRDSAGNIIPFQDRSTTRGTPNEGCINFGIYNAVDDLGLPAANRRYGPSPDGVTNGPIPGYRLVLNGNANPAAGTPAFYERPAYAEFANDRDVFAEQERKSLFLSGDFALGDVQWNGQFLYNNRQTSSRSFRQFFPVLDGRPSGFRGLVQPIMPFRSDQDIDVDFYFLSSSFDGGFGDTSWTWRADTTYSRSDGDYTVLSINRDLTGDTVNTPDRNGGGAPINYFTPSILSGEGIDALQDAIGVTHTGNTVYTQLLANVIATGEVFELPAGVAAAAVGTEFRRIEIDDNPSDIERTGGLWGQSSATGTEGKDYVSELFGELEVPLLAGIPGIEQLTANASARLFKYDTVADSDHVWKVGLGWQIIPSLRLRATNGTSYRAPGLNELFLGNQSGFLGQLAIDPCINWREETDANVRRNCQAAGIPDNYDGAGASATVIAGGGLGVLDPETSKSFTTGLVFTPEFANFTASIDYFNIRVNDQISQLGAANIVGSCYSLEIFPNEFCNLFTRNPGTGVNPFNIREVRNSFININRQQTRGYDLNMRWDSDYSFGKVEVEGQFTYTTEDLVLLFNSAEAGGFSRADQNGLVSRPELVGNLRTALSRGDWTYTWSMRYVDGTENFTVNPIGTYRGNLNAVFDTAAESALYHGISVLYEADKWSALIGVNNLFDKDPPKMSNGGGSTRYGTTPAFATQYDWYGRSIFGRVSYRF